MSSTCPNRLRNYIKPTDDNNSVPNGFAVHSSPETYFSPDKTDDFCACPLSRLGVVKQFVTISGAASSDGAYTIRISHSV
ncbi:hypothetical protein QTP88_028280 [Uroleucon formosanum]